MESIEQEIMELEGLLLDPAVRSDATELERLIADEFVEFGASGRSYHKTDMLDRLPVLDDLEKAEMTDFRCRMLGDAAHVHYSLESSYRSGEVRLTHRSSLWIRSRGGWQMVFHQGTEQCA